MFMDKLKKFFGAQDMTKGKPVTCILSFAMPLLIGNVAQQLYNTVDSIVVGKYVGDNALAAVGAAMPVFNLMVVLFSAIATGAGIMVAQYFGAREKEKLSHTVGNAMLLVLGTSLLMTVIGLCITRPLLLALSTPASILEMSVSYMTILFGGMVFTAFYNILSGSLRGMGDAVMPLVFLLVACGLNIVMDILFVAGMHMGVAGAAWATLLAQMVSCVLCVIRILRMTDRIKLDRHCFRLKKDLVGRIFKLGIPSGITMAIFSAASIMVQNLTNKFGETIIACTVMIMRVDGFAMMPNFTFGMAMSTYTGQNVGAGRMDRVNTGIKQGLLLSVTFAVVLTGCILIFGNNLLGLFTDTEAIISYGMRMMYILAAGYVAMSVSQVFSGTMQGSGDTLTPMIISIITTVVLRVPIAYIIALVTGNGVLENGNPSCIYWSLLISWVLGAGINSIFFATGRWRRRALIFAPQRKAEEE